jgi:threonine-phosphate decarboxylase
MRKLTHPYADPAPLFRHGGAPVAGRRALLDFSVNVNPLGPPASVLQAIRHELPAIARYPDPECRLLIDRLAKEHGVEPDQIVVGNGSNDLIYAIARALHPKHVAIAEPTYTEYLRASLLVGATAEHWLAEGAHFKMTPFDPQGANIVWLCNPNNPTGGLWVGAADLSQWMEAHPRIVFVIDEAFLPLCPRSSPGRGDPLTLISKLDRLHNLIVLRSLTKVYGLAGLRLGYAVTNAAMARSLRAELAPWSVNSLAQHAGLAALEDSGFWQQTRDWLTRTDFADELAKVARFLQPVPSFTSFVLVRLRQGTSARFAEQLEERGIIIRDAANFIGLDQRYVRIAMRTARDNGRLFEQLRGVLVEESN